MYRDFIGLCQRSELWQRALNLSAAHDHWLIAIARLDDDALDCGLFEKAFSNLLRSLIVVVVDCSTGRIRNAIKKLLRVVCNRFLLSTKINYKLQQPRRHTEHKSNQ
jgi:hypothetical protein